MNQNATGKGESHGKIDTYIAMDELERERKIEYLEWRRRDMAEEREECMTDTDRFERDQGARE